MTQPVALQTFFMYLCRAAGVDLPRRPIINFLGGATDDPTNNQINVPPGGSSFVNGIPSDPGAVGTAGPLFISPALTGMGFGLANPAGNFTLGLIFFATRPLTVTGVRFYGNYVGSKTWKIRLVDMTTGGVSTTIATATSGALTAPSPGALLTVPFTSPIALTAATIKYMVTVWDTSGGVQSGFTASLGDITSWVGGAGHANSILLLGPSLWQARNDFYIAGDGVPNLGGSSQYPCLEPVFTVP